MQDPTVPKHAEKANHLKLHTERMILRPLEPTDIDALYQLHTDPHVMRYLNGPQPYHVVQSRLEDWRAHQARHGFSIAAVLEKKTHCFIGCAGLFHFKMDETETELEMAYALSTAYWGQKRGLELCQALLAYASLHDHVKRIWAITRPGNYRSQKTLLASGMHYTHTAFHQGAPAYFYVFQNTQEL